MDPITNPFSPGAGSPPPELVGRDPLLEQARILLGRTKQKRPEKSLLLTGLRGVGKTVLLNEIERQATAAGYRTDSGDLEIDLPNLASNEGEEGRQVGVVGRPESGEVAQSCVRRACEVACAPREPSLSLGVQECVGHEA